MSDTNTPKPWFRPKTMGMGWTPQTWQGWLITLVFVVLIGTTIQMILPQDVGLSARLAWLAALRRDLGVPETGLGLFGGIVSLGLEIGVFLMVAWWTSRPIKSLD